MSEENDKDLAMTQKLFAFLQGKEKDGCTIKREEMPRLTAEQAWTVIWWLGNQYWQVTDCVERCDVCGELYDTSQGGCCLDYGKAPYNFCESCRECEEYIAKEKRKPSNY